ncbi:MAG: ATP-binding protein, partial [Mariprofundaceae bacterium]|nr:ATP-binding protein [Mariprofundaceae bacterium]
HDFNNMLAGMLGNLYLVQRDMQDHPEALKRLKRVEKQGYQAADVIRQLLTFARSGVMEKKDFDLYPFLKEIAKFARPAIPENIELVLDIQDVGMMVNGDPGRIQQAVLNLLTNARHAIESKFSGEALAGGGRVTLRAGICGKRAGCRGECCMRGQVDAIPEACVLLEVEDNGIGMDETTRGKVFDPYFTTKDPGRGTGLGLPMVQGCVELHGGCIEVESIEGQGALFRCWLPLLSESRQLEQADGEIADVQLAKGDGELILVADDNSDAREALSEILEASGFKVVRAADGEEARQQFFAHQKQLHAAFLDIVMPRCSGTVVAHYISEERPEMPIVLMTGYDLKDTLASEEFMLQGNIEVLSKPWNLTQVNATLGRIRGHYAQAAKSEA